MISQVRLRNFKGHVDTTVPLGRLTMLVGDNASGKTSVLEALWLFASVGSASSEAFTGRYSPNDVRRRGTEGSLHIDIETARNKKFHLQLLPRADGTSQVRLESSETSQPLVIALAVIASDPLQPMRAQLKKTVGSAEILRLRSDQIAMSAYSDEAQVRVESDGTNTAVALAAMKLSDDETFQKVESALKKLVPSLEKIRLRRANVERPEAKGGSVIGNQIIFDFKGAPDIRAHGASQGTLLALSLLTILFSANRPNLLLLDDFDHSLHPRAQMELMRMLKELLAVPEFQDVQIVATTHSPYVLDCLTPDEVHVFATRDDGTVASKRLSEHPQAKATQGAIGAGQLWSLDAERDWVIGK